MIYTFSIGNKLRTVRADKLIDAIETVCQKYYYSTCKRRSFFISSNDPLAPKDERVLHQHGLFGLMELKPISAEDRKKYKI